MLIRLIPSILLLEGRCVKGRNFGSYRDTGNPLTVARVYDAQGADELLSLDITASREGRPVLLDVVGHVAGECFMPLGVGGGVRDVSDFRALLQAGADKVCVNSGAVERPALLTEAAERFGEPRTYPRGIDVEVISTDILLEAAEQRDREHVTTFIRERPERYPAERVDYEVPGYGELRLTLDTLDDLAVIRGVVEEGGHDVVLRRAIEIATGDVLGPAG